MQDVAEHCCCCDHSCKDFLRQAWGRELEAKRAFSVFLMTCIRGCRFCLQVAKQGLTANEDEVHVQWDGDPLWCQPTQQDVKYHEFKRPHQRQLQDCVNVVYKTTFCRVCSICWRIRSLIRLLCVVAALLAEFVDTEGLVASLVKTAHA